MFIYLLFYSLLDNAAGLFLFWSSTAEEFIDNFSFLIIFDWHILYLIHFSFNKI